MFDEVEDFSSSRDHDDDYDDELTSGRTRRLGNKAWLNEVLEKSPLPAVWITNRIGQIDQAHRRRFDIHLHMDIPPVSIRSEFLSQRTSSLGVSKRWIERVSREIELSPGTIDRVTRVAKSVQTLRPDFSSEPLLESILNASSLALRGARLPKGGNESLTDYCLDTVNANIDLKALVDGLRRDSRCRIALYGPSGTGKSAFARNVARELNKPLMVERASDLLRPFVGETEANIARMFDRASNDGAVLVLDEVDSFLRSRSDLKQQWESTQVNEMLTQMEDFDGTLFVTSNFPDRMDSASQRRFDLKIEFDYLKPQQAAILLKRSCAVLELDVDDALIEASVLEGLTPGLFSVVMRQARFRPVADASDFIGRLRREASHCEERHQRGIGFLVQLAA